MLTDYTTGKHLTKSEFDALKPRYAEIYASTKYCDVRLVWLHDARRWAELEPIFHRDATELGEIWASVLSEVHDSHTVMNVCEVGFQSHENGRGRTDTVGS